MFHVPSPPPAPAAVRPVPGPYAGVTSSTDPRPTFSPPAPRRAEVAPHVRVARPKPPPSPAPPVVAPGGSVPDLIRAYFPSWAEGTALCVAGRESGFDPSATNASSGAAGVFQFLPRWWPTFAARAGWAGHSAYEARANVAVAAWTVTHEGWSPWHGGRPSCGV